MQKTPFLLLLSALLTACPSAPIVIEPPPSTESPRAYVPRAIGAGDTTIALKGQNFDVKLASVDGVPATILEQSATTLKLKLVKALGVGDFKLELTNKSGKSFSSQNGINAIAATSSSDEIDSGRLVLALKTPLTPKLEELLRTAGFILEQQDLPQIAGGTGLCSQVVVTLKLASSRTVEDALNALAELLGPELNQGEFEPNPFVIERGPNASSSATLEQTVLGPRAVVITPDYSKLNLRVAVLDTGVSKHAAFSYSDGTRVLQNVVDFTAGRNFTLEGSGISDVRDLRTGYATNSGISDKGHGTGVSAAIAAPGSATGSTTGIAYPGIAPKVSILPIKVCDSKGACNTPSLVAGICYAASLANATTKPVQVLNFSIGGKTPNRLLYLALRDAAERGISVVVSAGNKADSGNPTIFPAAYASDYSPSYPAIPGLITVGSVYSNDGPFIPSAFSSYGPWVTVSAEGQFQYLPNSSDLDAKNTYGSFTGTSFAAPQVAGMVVKIKAQKPTWTPTEVKDFLVKTANLVPNCPNNRCGAGRVNFGNLPNAIPQ